MDRFSCIRCGRLPGIHAPTACLIAVAMLWASYGVSMRLIYADPDAASAPILTAVKATITALSLLLCIRRNSNKGLDGYTAANPESDGSLRLAPGTHCAVPVSPGRAPARLSFLLHPTRSILLASLEIGLYAGIGSLFHAWGLSQIPAITSAFLVQTTTVFTPCISFLAGEHISVRVWIATAAAALGTVFIFLDGIWQAEAHGHAAVMKGSLLGKLSVLMAASMYSMGTMRISQVAGGFPVMNLAAGQAAVRAVVAVLAAMPEIATAVHHSSSPAHWLRDVWPNWDSPRAVALVSWTALGPGSLAFALQMYAQQTVAAPSAQVIYASTPIWAATYALLILSEKPFDVFGWVGAVCILGASVGVVEFGETPQE